MSTSVHRAVRLLTALAMLWGAVLVLLGGIVPLRRGGIGVHNMPPRVSMIAVPGTQRSHAARPKRNVRHSPRARACAAGARPDIDPGTAISEMLKKGGCDPFFSAMVKLHFNQMDERLAEKDTRLAEKDMRIAEKDMLVAVKDTLVAEKDMRIADKDERIVTFMRDLSRYKLVFEWRGTLDWYVRVLFPTKPGSPPGSLWKDLVTKDLADKNASVIKKVFADLQPHFPVSAQAMDRIRESFIDVYGAANGVMHQYPAIEKETGICCGGINLETMTTAAASVLALQRFGIKLGIPIPLGLDKVTVLNPSLDSVHGECVGGNYRIRRQTRQSPQTVPPRTAAVKPKRRGVAAPPAS